MKFSYKKTVKRFGLAAFLFFFIKGLIWLAVFFGAAKLFWPKANDTELTVWVAHAQDSANQTLRFHIVTPEKPDTSQIKHYGQRYLEEEGLKYHKIEITPCLSCVIEPEETALKQAIEEKGFAVYKEPAH